MQERALAEEGRVLFFHFPRSAFSTPSTPLSAPTTPYLLLHGLNIQYLSVASLISLTHSPFTLSFSPPKTLPLRKLSQVIIFGYITWYPCIIKYFVYLFTFYYKVGESV